MATQTLIAELGLADPDAAFRARRRLLEAVHQSLRPGGEAERETLTAALSAELQAPEKHSVVVRNWLCRCLGLLARESAIPALTAALGDAETCAAACAALGEISSAKADSVLRSRVGKEKDARLRLAFVAALARQRGLSTGRHLEGMAKQDKHEEVRRYALEAAANFPIILADPTFIAIARGGSPREQANAHRARLRFAECLRYSGYKHPARAVLESIIASEAPKPQRNAARRILDRMS